MRVAFLGTRGVPARYGGFETAAEEIGRRLVALGHEVIVYCRNGETQLAQHLGMDLVHLPSLRLRCAETLSHTALSVIDVRHRDVDVTVVFNTANGPLLPLLHRGGIPVALNVDGLDWQRAKWGPVARTYYRQARQLAVRWADELIADARSIQEYYALTFGVSSEFIAYGAPILHELDDDRLGELGLTSHGFHLVVARFEPENCIDVIVDGYRKSGAALPLVVVGSAPYDHPYRRRVERRAGGDRRIRLVGSIWDQGLLNQLYYHAASYLHGHSVGGTNPSLLRAMGAAVPVIAIDVNFTREVLDDTGAFFRAPLDLAERIEEIEVDEASARERGRRAQKRAALLYDWDEVALGYERLCKQLLERQAEKCPSSRQAPDLSR